MKRTEARTTVVNELIERMTAATEFDGVQPCEILSACMCMAQTAIAHLVRHSANHEARLLNQRVCLDAVDALKLAAVTPADRQMIM